MPSELATAIARKKAILFVGAGASMGLGAPSWSGLISHVGEELGYDADVFGALGASPLALAEFYKLKTGKIGPLRSWMDRAWHVDEDTLSKSTLHNLIVDLGFTTIYTTNFDRNLERIHDIRGVAYNKILNVKDVANARPSEVEIVKLHGDFDDDDTIVLTESSFFDRLNFEHPLDVKLRSDALGRAILFIGYSVTDMNIRLMLHKIANTWIASGYGEHRPVSYIYLRNPSPVEQSVLAAWNIKTVSVDTDDVELGLTSFLERLLEEVRRIKALPSVT